MVTPDIRQPPRAQQLRRRLGRLLYETVTGLEARSAGLRTREVNAAGVHFALYDSGPDRAPPLVLLHGLGGSRRLWTRVARSLRKRFRVLAPDLPGHGGTRVAGPSAAGPDAHAESLYALLQALGLETVHLVGNSLGGAIAARYAQRWPQAVRTLVLISPAGMPTPHPSLFDRWTQGGRNPFDVADRAGYDRFQGELMERPPFTPGWVREHLAHDLCSRRDAIAREWQALASGAAASCAGLLPPCLLIWGSEDRVVDVSGVPIWQGLMRRGETAICQGIGHLPMLEDPSRVAGMIGNFCAHRQAVAATAETAR